MDTRLHQVKLSDQPLRWLFLDLNSYFASVEQAEDPELRGKPVAVTPVMADSSAIIAASYEAKKFGIKTGTRVGETKILCSELILKEARPPLYLYYHRRILDAVSQVLPIDKVCSIDEMRFRLMGSERHPEEARAISQALKNVIRSEVSEALTCSVGVAPNAFLAKVATELQKPDGLVILPGDEIMDRLGPFPLTLLTGINHRMEARLRSAGVFRIADLYARSPEELRRAFGSVIGERWYFLLRGQEMQLPETDRKSLGHSHVLPPDRRTREGVREIMIRLLTKAAARLRAEGMVTAHVTFAVKGYAQSWKQEQRIVPTDDTNRLMQILTQAYESADFKDPRTCYVTFRELKSRDAATPSLFDFEKQDDPARKRFNQAVDQMNQKFGKHAVFLASMTNARQTASEKIAFDKTWLFQEGKGDNEWVNPRTGDQDFNSSAPE